MAETVRLKPETVVICIPLTVTTRQHRPCVQHTWALARETTRYSNPPIRWRTEWCGCGTVRYIPL